VDLVHLRVKDGEKYYRFMPSICVPFVKRMSANEMQWRALGGDRMYVWLNSDMGCSMGRIKCRDDRLNRRQIYGGVPTSFVYQF